MKGKLIKFKKEYELYDGNEMIGSTYPYQNIPLLSLKNCQVIELGYDLDELCDETFEHMGYHSTVTPHEEKQFKLGYKLAFQKALELMGDKKFTENDVRKAINEARFCSVTDEYGSIRFHYKDDKIIQSIQQTEWDVEIKMEMYDDPDFVEDLNKEMRLTPKILHRPKLDQDGCLILKRVV